MLTPTKRQTKTATQTKDKTETGILAYIERLNREIAEFAGCPGSLAEINADLKAARARLAAARA